MNSKKTLREKTVYRAVRLIATIILLAFIFLEELILKPLRKIKIVVLERTIKRWSGYWTIGILVTLKSIEGLLKIVILFAPHPWAVMFIVGLDAVLGFITMNIIIHGHENLKDFTWYVRFTAWIAKLKADVKELPVYQRTHARVVELKKKARGIWKNLTRKLFGEHNPKGFVRYVKLAVRLKLKKMRS